MSREKEEREQVKREKSREREQEQREKAGKRERESRGNERDSRDKRPYETMVGGTGGEK